MKIEWSEPAVEDLRSLHAYIAKDSAHYAASFIERLLGAVEQLVEFPESGRVVPELQAADVRELIVQGYRIIYQVETLASDHSDGGSRSTRLDPPNHHPSKE